MAASDSFRFPPCNFIKKKDCSKDVNFAKFLRTSFDRAPPDACFLSLSLNFERSFSEHLFYRAPLRNCLFHVQVAAFQPADTVKNYFTGAISFIGILYENKKAFIYLKSLEIICEEVNS